MYTMGKMREKFVAVFNREQAKVLADVINTTYSDLVKTDDFNELKDIVKDLAIKMGELADAQKRTETRIEELANAQKRTETRVEELADAQKRTETRIEELADAQKRTETRIEELADAQKRTELEIRELVVDFKDVKRQLGGISQSVGYGLEDKIIPFMADFVKKKYGIEPDVVERKNLIYPNGQFDELNIYVEGTKEGKKAFVIGECKAQPSKKDVLRFHEMIGRVAAVLKGEIFFFLVGYSFDPAVENYIRENYPNTPTYKSYEFELNYQRIV